MIDPNEYEDVPNVTSGVSEALPADSLNPDADVDALLRTEAPLTGEAPELTATAQPDLPPMSDQDAIDYATDPSAVRPPTAAPAAPAQVTQQTDPISNFDQGVKEQTAAQKEIQTQEQLQTQRQADALDRQAEIKRDQIVQKQMDDLADADARAKVSRLVDDAERDVADFKFHDYFSTLPTGKKVQIRIGAFLTGLGGGDATPMINAAINRDFEMQKAGLTSKENLVRMRREGVKDFDAALHDQRARIDLKNAAALDAAATEATAQALRTGNPLAQARARDLAAKLTQEAAVKRQDLSNKVYAGELEKARANMLNAKAGKLRAGAGTGGNGKLQALTVALTKSGGEITPDVAAVADQLHVKRSDLTSMAGSFKTERSRDLQERRGINTEVANFAKENQLPEITKRHQALTKIDNLLRNPNVDPLTQVLALMEFDKASKGGTATAGSMQAALSHLAGGTDKISQLFEKAKTGGLSTEQLNNLRTSVHEGLSQTKEEGNTVHEAFNQTFRNMDSYPDQKAIDRLADSNFGSLGYKRGPKTESKPETKGAPIADKTSTVDPRLALAQQALDDPEASEKDKMQARRIIFAAKKAAK